MRIQLFEFEDLSWFPNCIRKGETDYLRHLMNAFGFYKAIIPIISQALEKTGENRIIDLCSGGGGAIEQIYEGLNKRSKEKISVTLSDKFPNINAYKLLKEKSYGAIDFNKDSIDATSVPAGIRGFRTMFSAAHHFSPESIKIILKNSVDNNAGIGLFDGGNKSVLMILLIILLHPIVFLIFTPFFTPFKISRLLLTYIIPLIPLTTIWDGCVSILRLYRPDELLYLSKEIGLNSFTWESGKVKSRFGINVTYLIGYPSDRNKSDN